MLEDDKTVKRILRNDPQAVTRPLPNDATALHFARTSAAAAMLLDAGVDPNAKDKYGVTALDRIAALGRAGKMILRILKPRGLFASPAALAGAGDIASLRSLVLKNPQIARDPAVLQ